MIVSNGLEAARARPDRPSIVSIGVFDGVHLGHRAILLANVAKAQASGSQATVVTFDGHPKQVLLGRAPRTLTTLQHRLALFRDLGIEHTLVLRFDEALRQTTADQFLRQILHQTLHAQGFVLGFDSKFGKDQVGSAEFLRAAGEDVDVVERVSIRDRAISSTAIR
ncbi:MAG TPA: FAD synthetase family protein, partial [Planctomycetota bacterium]|nr:FAD synthetase family protein [Planctomycetota bacterium]